MMWMDGDLLPLCALVFLKKKNNFLQNALSIYTYTMIQSAIEPKDLF